MTTWIVIVQCSALFIATGLCEIGGGWFIWQRVREGAPIFYIFIGIFLLTAYGFLPTFQPRTIGDEFGRIDAAYGGIFVVMSFVWGRIVDGMTIDNGDIIGGLFCLVGVGIILGWSRGENSIGGAAVKFSNVTIEMA
mmetsp:Transcript_23779/g.30941  ORF Transcript_23779/g.30941 Transcript_23779/m.30941 type:complete len:137 (-) Transcript_23779:124-534(-)